MNAKRLTVQEKKDIFLALVQTQDTGSMSVGDSRRAVMQHYDISEPQLKQIEEEGLEKEWPPLDEAVQQAG